MERRLCKTCMKPIPKQRLDVLPNADTCIAHSEDKRARTADDVDCTDGADGGDMVRSMQSGSNHRRK